MLQAYEADAEQHEYQGDRPEEPQQGADLRGITGHLPLDGRYRNHEQRQGAYGVKQWGRHPPQNPPERHRRQYRRAAPGAR